MGGLNMAMQQWSRMKDALDSRLASPVFTASEIYQMALPLILDGLSIMFINMLITALISSAGEASVAAVNLVSPVFTLAICLLNGICAGGAVAVTRSCGSGDTARTEQAAWQILCLTFLAGGLMSLILILFPRPILTALYAGAEAEVLEKAAAYMGQGSFSLIVFSIYSGVFCILRGLGESKKCLYLTVIINASYLLFSVLFLNVLRMDIQGSALALILARTMGALAAVAFLLLPRDLPIRMTRPGSFSWNKTTLRTILNVSIPYSLEQMFLYGGNIVMTVIAVPLGTNAIAANSIASSLFGVVTAAASAAGNLGITVAGRCIGAGEKEHAYRYGIKMVAFAELLLLVAAAVIYPALPLLLEHLYPAVPAVQAEVLRLLRHVLIPMLLFWPVSNVIPCILRAGQDAVFPSVLSMASMWGVRIGCGYLLAFPMEQGLKGLWAAMWLEWAVRTAVLSVRFLHRKWLEKDTGI